MKIIGDTQGGTRHFRHSRRGVVMPEVSPKVAVVLISAGTAIAYWLTGLPACN